MDLSLSSRPQGSHMVVEVGGEIDVYTAPRLREKMVELVNAGHYDIIVDMEASTSSTRPGSVSWSAV